MLLFIDIEGVDEDGRPLTGLKKEDFTLRVNYTWPKIYSVDDLCPCGDAAPRLALLQAAPHYVFYFDYGLLGTAGRTQAIEEAKVRYNEYLKAGMGKTVWVGGCQSWYLDADGDPAMWPYSWEQWEKEHKEPDLDDFHRRAPAEIVPLNPAKKAA